MVVKYTESLKAIWDEIFLCVYILSEPYNIYAFMHLSAAQGIDPGTYGGIARDYLTFAANFWPGTGALDRFCTSEAR